MHLQRWREMKGIRLSLKKAKKKKKRRVVKGRLSL